ncbi:cell wall hydrolase [Sphingobium sp. AS12]|uniref:cell wall hydrolase n=1 Tax=Sphingobium sp. AS12 TaxID=2849495 RepID=UPI001C31D22B|nr:cell wall hydrolase [Sphingobium sp. AS12]MBV2150027.1 cell wall hydrolase [Sphingobium sp. AS12]
MTSKTARGDGHAPSTAQKGELTSPARPAILQALAGLLLLVAAFTTSLPSHAQVAFPAPMEDYSRALECLTLAVAYEAGYENLEGKQAVAEVVLNRLRSSSFQHTVCDVVFAGSTRRTGCQFSFTCDGSLKRRLPERVMLSARTVAEDALANRTPPRAPGATHYHAAYVNPYWAPSLTRVATIGAHIFYHPPGKPAPYGPIGLQGAAVPATSSLRASTDQQSSSVAPAVFAPWGLEPAALGTDRP